MGSLARHDRESFPGLVQWLVGSERDLTDWASIGTPP